MTPKEKAKKLFDYHYFYVRNDKNKRYISIQCALITVDEMIAMLPFTDLNTYIGRWCEQQRNYLNEVKQELEKL